MSTDYGVKYRTARDRILAEMMPLEWNSWRHLRRVGGVRYGARLRELKRLGYKIEDATANDKDGKIYRLMSPRPSLPEGKQVKIYLPEQAVITLLTTGKMSVQTKMVITDALQRFQFNRKKL